MISIPGTVPIIDIQKVEKSEMTTDNPNWKWSGPMTGNTGKFLKHFPTTGKHFISTGLIDSAYIAATAKVEIIYAVDKPYRLRKVYHFC